jgi:hypothetical protein
MKNFKANRLLVQEEGCLKLIFWHKEHRGILNTTHMIRNATPSLLNVSCIWNQFMGSIDSFVAGFVTTVCMIDDAALFYWASSQHLLIKMHGTVSYLFLLSDVIDCPSGGIVVWLAVFSKLLYFFSRSQTPINHHYYHHHRRLSVRCCLNIRLSNIQNV